MNTQIRQPFSATRAVNRLILFLNVLAGFALLISHFAAFVSPSKFWLCELIAISYPFWLVLNISFAISWVLQFHRFFLISIIAIVITYPKPGLFFQWHSSEKEKSTLLKVMTYNVRLFDLYNWTGNLKTREKIFDMLKDVKPDIICFQEYYNSDKGNFQNTDTLKKILKAKNSYVVSGITLRKTDHWGLAIFSSYPIVNGGTAIYKYGQINFAIYTDIKVNEDTIRIFNVHLQSNHLKENERQFLEAPDSTSTEEAVIRSESILKCLRKACIKRTHQVDELKAHILTSPYPVIVCGDFNDPPSSYTYSVLRKNLCDAFVENGQGFGVTYSGAVPFFRIDYTLYDDRLQCNNYKRINTKLSDHYPIVTEFGLK